MKEIMRPFGLVFLALVLSVCVSFVHGLFLYLGWSLAAPVFGLRDITYWQAYGISLVAVTAITVARGHRTGAEE